MSERTLAVAARVAELRAAFDRGFEGAPSAGRERLTDLLLIGVGGVPYALRVHETIALAGDRKIVRVPSPMPGLLGLCGFRGDSVPVFSIAALLGHAPGSTAWLAMCGPRTAPIGLAFDALEGYASASASQVHPLAERSCPHLSSTVTLEGSERAIVDLPSLIALIERREIELARASQEP
ncbi:MAG: chemotaxis protein CheW [Polyangia bacterium]